MTRNAKSLELISIADISQLLRVHQRTIARWVEAGDFPQPIRTGRLLRWKLADVETYLASRESA